MLNKTVKILVIRNDKIGDMVMSSCVFRELKKVFPKSEITVICSPENRPIIEKNKKIHKIIELRASPRTFSDLFRYLRTAKSLAKENFDIGFDLRGSFFNALLLKKSKIKKKIGFIEHNLSRWLLDFSMIRDKNLHESKLILELLNKSLKINAKNPFPDIQTDKDDFLELKKLETQDSLKKIICICPDASDEKKQWPLDNFVELIKYLHIRHPHHKIILIGADSKKINYLVENNNFCLQLIKKNLRLSYLLFKRSSMVISLDGGAAHIAGASGARTFVLIPGYLRPDHVKPLGKSVEIIFTPEDIKDIDLEAVKRATDKIHS